MTQYLGSTKNESRAIYWLRYIRKGMELPKNVDLISFETAKKIARKMKRKGYQGEIYKVRQTKDYYGWGTDGMNVKQLWTF
jgi:Cys-tRNA synthase (O-phospho-L-seryl-tRNA:Cys-tRNA synthase)